VKIAAGIGLAPAKKMGSVIKKTGEKVHATWERFWPRFPKGLLLVLSRA